MRPIANVLCPIDLSPPSARALEWAVAVAKAYAARLCVLQVIDLTTPPVPPGSPWIEPELSAELRKACLDNLDVIAGPACAAGVPVETRLAEGRVVDRILHEATAIQADLIVMGTHGRGGFEHLVLGSVTEKVLRKASCPVLAVPPAAAIGLTAGRRFQSILCPVDFSSATRQALDCALVFVSRFHAALTLMTVVDWPFGDGRVDEMPSEIGALRESLEQTAGEQLHDLALASTLDGPPPAEIVAAGKPAHEILRVARDRGSDLIVMGVYGRGAIDLAVLGSVTHRVVREAACPVLVARGQ